MTYIKKIWKYVIMALYFFFSGYSLPWLLTAAFNYSKGIANNPDGEGLMPFGIIGVLIIIIIDILIIRSHSRNIDNTKKEKIRFFFTICVNTKNGIKYRMAIGRESRKTA